MVKYIAGIFVLWTILSSPVLAQSNSAYEINVQIDHYKEESCYMAQYYGNKPYLMDTVARTTAGNFRFSGEEALDPGMYFIVLPPEKKFVQFLLDEKDQKLTIKADYKELANSIKIEGSAENDLFNEYLEDAEIYQKNLDSLRNLLKEPGISSEGKLEVQEVINEYVANRKAINLKFAANHPNTVTSVLVQAEVEPTIPDFEGEEEEVKLKKYYYRKNHYFDNTPLDENRLLRAPVLFKRVQFFVEKMTVQFADSLIISLDRVLDEAIGNEENFQFFLTHFINTYIESNTLGFDAIFVHLVEKYIETGKAPFIEGDILNEVIRKAKRMKPTLIGKKAPEITVYDRDDNPVNLYDVEAEYTIIVFWRPGCSTCQKSMPHIIDFYDNYKDQNVKVFSVCTDTGEKANECWPYTEQKGMDTRFINTYDPKNQSRYYQKYDVRTTPKILILDKNKEILVNRMGAQQIGDLLEQLKKRKTETK